MKMRFWIYCSVPAFVAGVWLTPWLHRPSVASPILNHERDPKPSASIASKIPESVAVENPWEDWQQRLARGGQEDELAAELEALVHTDPLGILHRIGREKNPIRRCQLMKLVLMLWAELDPDAAADAAVALSTEDRRLAVAAVLAGAAKDPAVAIRLGREVCRKDPEFALEHGYSLVTTLAATGQFRAAVEFAATAATGAENEDGTKWLKAAYAEWAAEDPQAALNAVTELSGPAQRFEALDAVAVRRVEEDPAHLAVALRKLPSREDRNIVLGQTLRTWVNSDVRGASQWLNQQDPQLDLDVGAAAVAHVTKGQMTNQRPEVALSWAESIVGPEMRSQTLAAVVTQWAATEPSRARGYVENSSYLLPADRADLLAALPVQHRP